jgi:S-DNA-T family DNA segregation ATPase FtsK/SpoIIIE
MKPIELALTPTRNRRLNEVTGMVLLVAASLLFLALASYRPTDPSFNTVGGMGRQAHNWIGLLGACISDLLLQLTGVAAFLVPFMLGALGWS